MEHVVQPRLLDLRAAAVYLGISSWTLRDLIWGGELASVRLGRKIFVTRADLDGLVSRLRHFEGVETRGKSGARPA
jgi:excisionase family DNA binding protein